MKKTITICDKCGSDREPFQKFSFFKERRSNGTESENWNWYADLCSVCAGSLIHSLVKILEASDQATKDTIAKIYNCKEI